MQILIFYFIFFINNIITYTLYIIYLIFNFLVDQFYINKHKIKNIIKINIKFI